MHPPHLLGMFQLSDLWLATVAADYLGLLSNAPFLAQAPLPR